MALTSISSWCPRIPPSYSIKSLKQSASAFSVIYKTGESYFYIQSFEASATCGSTTWKYTGVDSSTQRELVFETD